PHLVCLLEDLDLAAGGPDRDSYRGVFASRATVQRGVRERQVGGCDGELGSAPHPRRRRRAGDLLEVEIVHLAAAVHLVARGVEARDLGDPRRSGSHGRPEALPPGADRCHHARPGHHHAAGPLLADRHAGRSSPDAGTRAARSTAANVSFALATGVPSTSATPRTIAAVEITFSATTSRSSW